MVGGRGQSAYTVVTSRETASDNGLEKTLTVAGIVDTLEESKISWDQELGLDSSCLPYPEP